MFYLYPLSTYEVVWKLTYGAQSDKAFVKSLLKPYNLFAFVIHDPDEHKNFDSYLVSEIEQIDHLCGSDFLLFALVDPPKDWMRYVRSQKYFKTLDKELIELLKMENPVLSHDPSITAAALATSLSIPLDRLTMHCCELRSRESALPLAEDTARFTIKTSEKLRFDFQEIQL